MLAIHYPFIAPPGLQNKKRKRSDSPKATSAVLAADDTSAQEAPTDSQDQKRRNVHADPESKTTAKAQPNPVQYEAECGIYPGEPNCLLSVFSSCWSLGAELR